MPRMKNSEAGELIWDALASGAKLTKAQIVLITGLTESQWHNGLRYIKDVFQGERGEPIAINRQHQYFLAEEWRESRDYINLGLRGLITRARRISANIAAAAERFPGSPAAGRVRRDALRLIDDLHDMSEEIVDHSAG